MEKVTLVEDVALNGFINLLIEGVDLGTGQVIIYTISSKTPASTLVVNGKIVDGKLVKE